MPSALIAQSGGLTGVMNTTLIAAIREAREAKHTFSRFLGSIHGLRGILEDRVINLFSQDETLLGRLAEAPGAALGSSRMKLTAEEIGRLLEAFKRHVSEMDKRSAELCGRVAVCAALSGESGKMVALRREPGSCAPFTKLVPLGHVARKERSMPPEFLSDSGNDVTAGEVEHFPRLLD